MVIRYVHKGTLFKVDSVKFIGIFRGPFFLGHTVFTHSGIYHHD